MGSGAGAERGMSLVGIRLMQLPLDHRILTGGRTQRIGVLRIARSEIAVEHPSRDTSFERPARMLWPGPRVMLAYGLIL